MALLRGDKVLFDSSLQMAERWIGDFFDPEATATQAIVQALRGLRAVDIRPELPDLSRSLMALQERQQAADGEGARQ
jgi:uroporphyrin-3 C-methyltransferase